MSEFANIIYDLQKLNNRRTGKTYHAVNFFKNGDDSILICFNMNEARRVKSEYGIKTMSISDVLNGRLRGVTSVTYYDQECLVPVVEKVLSQQQSIDEYRDKLKDIIKQNGKQKQRIDELVDEGGKLLYKYNGLKIQLSKKDSEIDRLEKDISRVSRNESKISEALEKTRVKHGKLYVENKKLRSVLECALDMITEIDDDEDAAWIDTVKGEFKLP